MSTPRVLVLSGPNLDRLGKREPHIYGSETLDQIYQRLTIVGAELGVEVDARQSNHEGTLVDWIGAAEDDGFSAILLNAGAYTHTSLALYDALKASSLPAVEVHLSNPAAREAFRHPSRIAAACVGVVSGFRGESYIVALWAVISAALRRLDSQSKRSAAKGDARKRRAAPKKKSSTLRNKRKSA
ncbi:MAG TPA: type II 3-dehydroquinate dehydratase [Polyangiaceae bacterium]|jgi:3-dehydroquinate dehydratase-2|nr:type II 3-dehydroquinate dehydratase [Polyangiaceae bacterium]